MSSGSSWGGGWLSSIERSLSLSSEPEPESEQQAKTPVELVAELTAEEGEVRQADRDALLAIVQGAGATSVQAEVASALAERLQLPSIIVKIKTTEVIALLTKNSGFVAAARPCLEELVAEHVHFGEQDPKDDSAAQVRKAAAESSARLATSERGTPAAEPEPEPILAEEGAASEGVPPEPTGAGVGADQDSAAILHGASSGPEPVTGDRRAAAAGAGIERRDHEALEQRLQVLEDDVEQLENAQVQLKAEAGQQQQLQARVQALDEQLRQLSAQVQGVPAETAAALASQADSQKQQADRLSALEAQMQTMTAALSQTTAQFETERSRAAAAEQRLSTLLNSHEQTLESHAQKHKESDGFEISTSEALADEVAEVKKQCLAHVQSVADESAMLKETVHRLMEQVSQGLASASGDDGAADALDAKIGAMEVAWGEKLADVERAVTEATRTASTQLTSSVEELGKRIDFMEVELQAESHSEAFAGQDAGVDQATVDSGSSPPAVATIEVAELKQHQADVAKSVQDQTERVSALEQRLETEKASRTQQKEVFDAFIEMKVEGLKQELLDAGLEQQKAADSRLNNTQQSLEETMNEYNKQARIRLKQLEDGMIESKEKRRRELQAEVERLSGMIDEKVAAERDQAVAREARAAELAEEGSNAVSAEFEQLKQGQAKQSERVVALEQQLEQHQSDWATFEQTAKSSREQQQEQTQAAVSECVKSSDLQSMREQTDQLIEDRLREQAENFKADREQIFNLIRERAELAAIEDLNRRIGEALERADGFDSLMADHHKALEQSNSMLQERLDIVEAAHAASQAALESEVAKEKNKAEAAAAEKVAQVEQDVSALKADVVAGNAATVERIAQVEQTVSTLKTDVQAANTTAAVTAESIDKQIDKQEKIVRALATKTMGVEEIAGKKLEKLEKEVGETVSVMGAKVETMEERVEDFNTWRQTVEAEKLAQQEEQQARAEEPFRLSVSSSIIRKPALGKQFVCYEFEVSYQGRAHSFYQRWSAIEKFVAEARKELNIPKEIAWPAKWTSSSMKPEDLERRRHQLDAFFGMFFGWGQRNQIPLLKVPCVQRFLCQEGELPGPERNISIPRLLQEHLVKAELRSSAQVAAAATPPSGGGSEDGREAAVTPGGKVYSAPPGAAS